MVRSRSEFRLRVGDNPVSRCEDGGNLEGHKERCRCVTARPPDEVIFPCHDPGDRIVGTVEYLPVVKQECIRDTSKVSFGCDIIDQDGLLAEISARHDE